MTARIYDGAEAQALREAAYPPGGCPATTTPCECFRGREALRLAGLDLAASVEHHARYADKAEAELTEAHARARDAEAERAAAEAALTAVWQAITDDNLPRLPGGDGTVVDAEAVGRRVAALVSQRDTANADFVGAADGGKHLARQVDHLEGVLSSIVRGILDAIGARDRAVPNLPFASLVAWLATETRLVVDDLAMARDNHHARAERAEAERDALRAAVREYLAAEREYERDPCVDSDRYIAASKTLAALVEVTP